MTYDNDYASSDDVRSFVPLPKSQLNCFQLDAILEMSRSGHRSVPPTPAAGPSKPSEFTITQPSYLRKQELNRNIAQIDAEIAQYDFEIEQIRGLRAVRMDDRQKLIVELEQSVSAASRTGKGKPGSGVDYGSDEFEWSSKLKRYSMEIFGIEEFRLCQKGCVVFLPTPSLSQVAISSVCNANLDGRDIVCVMPTGRIQRSKFDFQTQYIT